MYELSVFTACRGLDLLVPVFGAAAFRLKGILPKPLLKLSSGSVESNPIGLFSPPPCARPNTWSMNWPQLQANWLRLHFEYMFSLRSLDISRLEGCRPAPTTGG